VKLKPALSFLCFALLALTGLAIEPRKRVLISDILTVVDARANLERLRLENVEMVRSLLATKPGERAPDAYGRRVLDRALEKYADYSHELFSWSRWEDTYAAQYDRYYTEAQLKALLAFMKTDAGQAMIRAERVMAAGLQQKVADGLNTGSDRTDHIMKEAADEVAAEMRAENDQLLNASVAEVEVSARAGNPFAQYLMGGFYVDGKGVEKDPVVAAKWFRMGAEHKHPGAMGRLGWAYWLGDGVEKDTEQAKTLFTQAANAGDTPSMYALGFMFSRGEKEGATKDYHQAFPWFLKAAELGHGGAQYELAVLYWNGTGVEKKPIEALAWVRVARDTKVKGAEELDDFMSKSLSSDDMADGMMRSAELRRAIKAQR
jgi:TPR repeat protein